MSRRHLAVAVVAALIASSAPAQPAAGDSLTVARQYAEWFLGGQSDSLWAHSTVAFRAKLTRGTGEFLARQQQLIAQVGTEEGVTEERFVRRNGATQYWRTSRYSRAPEPVMVRFVLDRDLRIRGMGLNPAGDAPPVDVPQSGR